MSSNRTRIRRNKKKRNRNRNHTRNHINHKLNNDYFNDNIMNDEQYANNNNRKPVPIRILQRNPPKKAIKVISDKKQIQPQSKISRALLNLQHSSSININHRPSPPLFPSNARQTNRAPIYKYRRKDIKPESTAADIQSYEKRSYPLVRINDHHRLANDFEHKLSSKYSDFMVIGIIGCQNVGKSTILSFMAETELKNISLSEIFPTNKFPKLLDGHKTSGIKAYMTEDHTIFLDSQPIFSSSLLFSLTNLCRRCMYDNTNDKCIVPLDMWKNEMTKVSLFMMNVCHVMLVVSDLMCDCKTWNFIKNICILRQKSEMRSFLKPDQRTHSLIKEMRIKINNIDDQKHDENEVRNIDDQILKLSKKQRMELELHEMLANHPTHTYPNMIFIFNKLDNRSMNSLIFNEQRKALHVLFSDYFVNESHSSIGNIEYLGYDSDIQLLFENMEVFDNQSVGSDDNDIIDDKSRNMNCFFLPNVNSLEMKHVFYELCTELRNQISLMHKPLSLTLYAYKNARNLNHNTRDRHLMSEKEWYQHCEYVWMTVNECSDVQSSARSVNRKNDRNNDGRYQMRNRNIDRMYDRSINTYESHVNSYDAT